MPPFAPKNGWRNTFEILAATHGRAIWDFAAQVPLLRKAANRLIIDQMVYKMRPRPGPLSTKATYTSWDSLT